MIFGVYLINAVLSPNTDIWNQKLMDELENEYFMIIINANLFDIKSNGRYNTKKHIDKYSIQNRTYSNFLDK